MAPGTLLRQQFLIALQNACLRHDPKQRPSTGTLLSITRAALATIFSSPTSTKPIPENVLAFIEANKQHASTALFREHDDDVDSDEDVVKDDEQLPPERAHVCAMVVVLLSVVAIPIVVVAFFLCRKPIPNDGSGEPIPNPYEGNQYQMMEAGVLDCKSSLSGDGEGFKEVGDVDECKYAWTQLNALGMFT